MPGLDGFALCKRLRDRNVDVPIILLTSRDSELDEALGLELGADDSSPSLSTRAFSWREFRLFCAEIRFVAKRETTRRTSPSESSPSTRSASKRGTQGRCSLSTLTEFRMLEALASRPGIVLSRARLLELVRGDESVVADRIVDTYVRRLRKKFEAIDSTFADLETVVGAGYRWRR